MFESFEETFTYNFKHSIIYTPFIILDTELFRIDYLGKLQRYKYAYILFGLRDDGLQLTVKFNIYDGAILPLCCVIVKLG